MKVSVKVIEFAVNKQLETGFNAYFKHRENPQPYGRVSSRNGTLQNADLTFPSANAALNVFVDRISTAYGDMELTIQALVNENRATILSQPTVMVQVGSTVPTIIETTRDVPYESLTAYSTTTYRVTSFKPTGLSLNVAANQVIDDDANPATLEDTYIKLTLTASVSEKGDSISIAMDPVVGGATIDVPQFVSRTITTTAIVRHGQTLILGGLFLKKVQKDLSTLPYLSQGEDFANSMLARALPFGVPEIPMSATIGKQNDNDLRRELVFLIRAELWKTSFTVADEFGFSEEDSKEKSVDKKKSPSDVITGVIGGLKDLPQGIAHGIGADVKEKTVSSDLGGNKQ